MKNDKKNELLQNSNNGFYFFKLIIGRNLSMKDEKRCKNVKNPFYDDKNASLSIYKNDYGIWCYKDYGNIDFHGDVFHFCAIHYKLDIKKDFVALLNLMENDLDRSQTKTITTNHFQSDSAIESKNGIIDVELKKIDFSEVSQKYFFQYGIATEILNVNNVFEITGYRELFSDNSFGNFNNLQHQTFYAYKVQNCAKLYSPNPKKFLYVGKKPKTMYLVKISTMTPT